MAKRGVYFFFNRRNHKVYIGSSNNINRRLSEHLRQLRRGKHKNKPFQLDWSIYGEDAFQWGILALVESGSVEAVEQHYINQYQSFKPEHGYNLSAHTSGLPFLMTRNWRNHR